MQLGLHLETDCVFSIQVPQKRTEIVFAYFGPVSVIFIRNQRHPMYSLPYDPSTPFINIKLHLALKGLLNDDLSLKDELSKQIFPARMLLTYVLAKFF